MTAEQTATYLQALLASVTISVIIPLLILGLLVIAAWVLISRAQHDPDFNIAEVFKDENNKVSSERVVLLATWGSTTYALVVILFAYPQHVETALGMYIGAWAVNNAAKYIAAKKYTPE